MQLLRNQLYRPEAQTAMLGLLADMATDSQFYQIFLEN